MTSAPATAVPAAAPAEPPKATLSVPAKGGTSAAASGARPKAAPAGEALPVARVYFALDRFALPGNVDRTLDKVVAYLKSNPAAKAVLMGFHDPQGKVTREYNQQLALKRAQQVQGALQRAGIAADRIVLEKPTETTGTGAYATARRVEVAVRP